MDEQRSQELIYVAMEDTYSTDVTLIDVDVDPTVDLVEKGEEEEEGADNDANVDKDILFGEEGDPLAVISVLQSLLSLPMDEMGSAARDGIGQLNLKKTGSVNYETKPKLLLECWLTPSRKSTMHN